LTPSLTARYTSGVGDVLRAVTGQIDWWWRGIFRPRLTGLTDDEYLWAPVDDCWTLHPAGDGASRIDSRWPPPKPAPFTTIAWRMQHIGAGCLARRTTDYFPSAVPEPWEVERYATVTPFPLDASGAVEFLDRWWRAWRGAIGALEDDHLWRPIGNVEGDIPAMQLGVSDPLIGVVLHQHRELLHHGAEISLLRDLYVAEQPKDAFVTAVLRADRAALETLVRDQTDVVDRYREERPDLALRATEAGQPDAVRLVAALGFDLNRMSDGHTALHHAVAGGDVEMVELLLGLGADPSLEDRTYHSDALAWAEHFRQHAAAELLRSRTG
jgi:hypothetical protein